MSASAHPILQPGRIGSLVLKNRVIKTATFEGMSPNGMPSDRLLELHRTLAANDVAMTTVAYWAVSPDARTFGDQMYARPEVVPALGRLTDAVHEEGGTASIQLSHCGHFSRNRKIVGRGPLGPSFSLNRYGLMSAVPFGYAMTRAEMQTTAGDFARAALLARDAGFDAVELHYGHGYLLSQFLSPASNRRRDEYGGAIENRLRFPLMVLRRVREALGAAFPILAKINLRDGFRGGLEIDEAIEVARALERESIDAIVMSGGFTAVTPFFLMRGETPLRDMIEVEKSFFQRLALRRFGPRVMRSYPFTEMFFLDDARKIRQAVRGPLVLLGGIVSADNMRQAMDEGFDFVALGRALIADPDLVRRIERGEPARTRCIQCNRCVAEIDRDGVRCVLDDAVRA